MGKKIFYMAGTGAIDTNPNSTFLTISADKGSFYGITDKTYMAKDRLVDAVAAHAATTAEVKRGLFSRRAVKKPSIGFVMWADTDAVLDVKHHTDGTATVRIIRGTAANPASTASSFICGPAAQLLAWPPDASEGVRDKLALSIDDDIRRASVAEAKRVADAASLANIDAYTAKIEEFIDRLVAAQDDDDDDEDEDVADTGVLPRAFRTGKTADAPCGTCAWPTLCGYTRNGDFYAFEKWLQGYVRLMIAKGDDELTRAEAADRTTPRSTKLCISPDILDFVANYRRLRPELIKVTCELAQQYGIPYAPADMSAVTKVREGLARIKHERAREPFSTVDGFGFYGVLDKPTPVQGRKRVDPPKPCTTKPGHFDAEGPKPKRSHKKAVK